MFRDFAMRVLAPAFLSCMPLMLSSCTMLVSEKPIFTNSDFDATGALVGHYDSEDQKGGFVVMPGSDSRLQVFGFETIPSKRSSSPGRLVQISYAEVAAIPLGNGDFALQFGCTALAENGKTFGSLLGGSASRYGNYTAYGIVAQDRKKDHQWVSTNFYEYDRNTYGAIFSKYAIKKHNVDDAKGKGGATEVEVIPPDTSRSAAQALFRDLIAADMLSSSDSQLSTKTNSDGELTDDERAAVVLNSSDACVRVQDQITPLR
jgi:hypothetical protein